MEQQEINYQFQSIHEEGQIPELIFQDNNPRQRSTATAQKRQRQIYKYLYTNLPAYEQFFSNRQCQLNLYKSKKSFYLHSNLHDRQRLSLERQMMHYRGSVDEFVSQKDLQTFIMEEDSQSGFVNKKRNTSLIIKDVMYFANLQAIYAIQLPKPKGQQIIQVYSETIRPIKIMSFQKGDQILEIQELKSFHFNFNYNEAYIIIRLRRKITIYNVNQGKVQFQLGSDSQFVQFDMSGQDKNILDLIECDGTHSMLTQYEIFDQNVQKYRDPIRFDNLIVSAFHLNRNQIFITKYDGFNIYDRRIERQINMYQVKSLDKQRLYNSIPIKGLYNFSPFVACCESRHISIFDMRKTNQYLVSIAHQCQQSPPQIMQFYDGTLQSDLMKPILCCHSPYALGSSLFTHLDVENFQLKSQVYTDSFAFKSPNYFNLLYAQGNSSLKNNFQETFNRSISCSNFKQEEFAVFQIDNHGSMYMERFFYNETKDMYQRRVFQSSDQSDFLLRKKIEKNNIEVWFEQNLHQKYFILQNQYQEIEQEDQSQKNIKSRRKAVKNKKNRKHTKIQKKKQELTEIQEIQLLDAQYSNSSGCEEAFSKRKMNYSDFNRFVSTLQYKAAQNPLQTHRKQHKKDDSLNSTQANSQGFTFSQNLIEQAGTRTLNFHNKKVMNFSFLQKMKNNWDN